MAKRGFRTFATKEDLQSIFIQFESAINVYYVPTYSDTGVVEIDSIMKIESLGVNRWGSHIGDQFLVFPKDKKCIWREYQYKNGADLATRYTTLCDENVERIDLHLGGIYDSNNLFPTTISTMHYENESSKILFDKIKKVIRSYSVQTIRGYFICPSAYEKRAEYRFCTIEIKTPKEYDLTVQ